MKPAESSPAPAPSDDRGGLLDAIRKAGGKEGAGLKSIKERKAEERKRRQGEEEAAPKSSGGGGGGDLLGDLSINVVFIMSSVTIIFHPIHYCCIAAC